MRHGRGVPQRRGGTDHSQRGTGLAPHARVRWSPRLFCKAKALKVPFRTPAGTAQRAVARQRSRLNLDWQTRRWRVLEGSSARMRALQVASDRYGDVRTACKRSEKQRCASAKAIRVHRSGGGARVRAISRGESAAGAQGLTVLHTRPNQQTPAGMVASTRADRTLVACAEQVTTGVHPGTPCTGRTRLPPRSAAGWRAG